jgi:ABC-2 type transport system permease protein
VSIARSVRALPALMRVGFLDALAYRAEMLVWVLATTMPLIMLALWVSVAEGEPIGGYGEARFVAYFLATFVVRQLTGSWASWQINMDIRDGTLAMRLLRPVHPLVVYAVENVAALPMRCIVSLPMACILLATVSGELAHGWAMWLLWCVSMLGAWLVTLLANFAIGALAFVVDSSIKVMDAWLALFFVFSGYLIPVSLFPPAFARLVDVLPFRYQIGLPVEIMIGAHDMDAALWLVAKQWAWVVAFFVLAAVGWRRGVARFAAFGG